MPDDTSSPSLLELTAEIVAAHVANNHVSTSDLSALIQGTHAALSGLGQAKAEAPASGKPQGAVSVRKSLANDQHIISMIDGQPYKMLRRHIGQHGYTDKSYREAFGLPKDYPMVARAYAETRRTLAKAIGLGRKAGSKVVDAVQSAEQTVEAAVAPKRRGRLPKLSGAEALAAVRGKAPRSDQTGSEPSGDS